MELSTGNYWMSEIFLAVTLLLAASGFLFGHCDTMDGPVISDARKAFSTGRVEPVLKWVLPDDEQQIRDAFSRAVAVRKEGDAAAEMAEMYFYETLVRVHRAGEGAPYTGLKPAGQHVEPAVAAADKALDNGNIRDLVEHIKTGIEEQVIQRFERVERARALADDSVEQGREYVDAYVDYVHYIKGVADRIHGNESHNH